MGRTILEVRRRDGRDVLTLEKRGTKVDVRFATSNVADDVALWLRDGVLERPETGAPLRRTRSTEEAFFDRLAQYLARRGFEVNQRTEGARAMAIVSTSATNNRPAPHLHSRPRSFRADTAPLPPNATGDVVARLAFARAAS